MFKALKEKLTSWFKKSEGEDKKKVKGKASKKKDARAKEKKKKVDKKAKKGRVDKKTEGAEKKKKIEKVDMQDNLEEIKENNEIVQVESPVVEVKEDVKVLSEEKKEGFFKRIFSRKKEEKQAETGEESKEQIERENKLEEVKHEIAEKIEQEEDRRGFFAKLASKLSTSTLTQEQFDELFPELEMTLLENNVALEVVDKIHNELSKDLVGIEVKKSQIKETIFNSLKEAIDSILIEPSDLLEQIKKKDGIFTIIFVGINGSGKTTSVAKLAYLLKQKGISCVLAAADTFRAASIEQLKIHANNLNLPIIASEYGADPASVAFDARKYAEAHNIKVVLIDTAGRMYTKINLIKEMEKIVRVSQPDLKLFVGESITGNDATEQARTFNEAINLDGIILTKADVDEKAGTILSVSQVTGKPIYYLGMGQDYSDLVPFKKKDVLKNLGLE